MDAVSPMGQGMKQGEQILDMLPAIQSFNFDGLKCQRRRTASNFSNQGIKMRPRPDQNGNAFSRVITSGLLNKIKDTACLGLIGEFTLGCDQRVNTDPAIGTRGTGGGRFGIPDRPHRRTILHREDAGEGGINPIDHGRKGAVVTEEPEMLKRNAANPQLANAQEQTDISLAKTVDRLHRIANHKQRPAVIRRPATDQLFDQINLTRAGVLKFIDQQMADPVIQCLCQIRRCFVITQRQTGPPGNFNEIDLSRLLKRQPKLPRSQPEQAREDCYGAPLKIGKNRSWQFGELRQRHFGIRNTGQISQKFDHRIFLRLERFVGREADIFGQRLT